MGFLWTLRIFFREHFSSLLKAIIPVFLVYFILNPLYWMWEAKLNELGYGIYLLTAYTLIYLLIFFWCWFILSSILKADKNEQSKIAKKSLNKEEDRLDKLKNLENFPKLRTKSERILSD